MLVANEVFKKWIPRIEFLQSQWIEACHSDRVFWQINAIVDSNVEVKKYRTIHTWLVNGYTTQVIVSIRAIGDRKRGARSLYKLIEEMVTAVDELPNRTEYGSSFPVMVGLGALVNDAFSELAGENAFRITRKKLQDDQETLRSIISDIENYANTYLLHWFDPRESEVPVRLRFDDLRTALLDVGTLLNKYAVFLTGATMPDYVPIIHEEGHWLDAFRAPWLPPDVDVPPYRSLNSLT